jgi:hypothetical protein
MKKQLDTSVMENELRSGSAFFRAVPQRQKEPEKSQFSPIPAELKNSGRNVAVTLSSPLDSFSAIKPPKKEANPAPIMPLEVTKNQQPTTPPSLSETPRQTGGEAAKQTVSLPDASPPLPALRPTLPQREETKERTDEPSNERTNVKRQKIRHTFDIYADQLLSLKEIQLGRARVWEKVYRLGDLVQEALDALITKELNKE